MSSKRQMLLTLGCLFAVLYCTGCWNTAFIASAQGHVDTKVTGRGKRFSVKVPNNFSMWGTVPRVKVIEVDRAVARALRRPVRRITGLRITQHLTFFQGLLEFFTYGLYNPRTLIIEGELHE